MSDFEFISLVLFAHLMWSCGFGAMNIISQSMDIIRVRQRIAIRCEPQFNG